MKLDLWDIELRHGDYIRKIIYSKLDHARDDQRDRVYQAVLKSLRKKAAAGYELKAEHGIKSLRTFLKRITLRRVIDYHRKQTAEEARAGIESRQASLDVDMIGAWDESIGSFLRQGPRGHIDTIGGVEVRPLLNKIRNRPMWIRWAMELDSSKQLKQEQRAGWPEARQKRAKTPRDIKAEIAADYGISEEAVRLRLYRGRRKFWALYEKERRLLGLRSRRDRRPGSGQV